MVPIHHYSGYFRGSKRFTRLMASATIDCIITLIIVTFVTYQVCLWTKGPILIFLPTKICPISIEPKWRWRRFAENICWDSKRPSRLMALQLRIGSSPLSYHSSHKVLAEFYRPVVVINQIYHIYFSNISTQLVHLLSKKSSSQVVHPLIFFKQMNFGSQPAQVIIEPI